MTDRKIVLIPAYEDTMQPVDERFVLVPREPTQEMIRANLDCQDYDPEDPAESEVYCLYCAMLSAAPTPDIKGVEVPSIEADLRFHGEYRRGYANALDELNQRIKEACE